MIRFCDSGYVCSRI
uniref:Uncharacterized protein n=1 Tax=Anguilla anguilla TaxID=7936 RepID=A0A0E9RRE0_ANGAN